jgi:hypothetical protein
MTEATAPRRQENRERSLIVAFCRQGVTFDGTMFTARKQRTGNGRQGYRLKAVSERERQNEEKTEK